MRPTTGAREKMVTSIHNRSLKRSIKMIIISLKRGINMIKTTQALDTALPHGIAFASVIVLSSYRGRLSPPSSNLSSQAILRCHRGVFGWRLVAWNYPIPGILSVAI